MVISFTSFLISDVETAFHSLPFSSIPFFSLPFPSLLLSSLPFSSLLFSSLPFPSLPFSSPLFPSFPFPSTPHTVDFGFQTLDSSFCQWNLDSVFQSLVSFRIPWAVFRIPKPRIPDSYNCIPDCKAQDFGFLQLHSQFQSAGFRIPTAVLRIPKPRIPDSYTCTPDSKAQDSGFQSPGFRIPATVIRIIKRRIPDSTSTKFPRFRNPDFLTWAVTRFEWYDFCDRCAESLHFV